MTANDVQRLLQHYVDNFRLLPWRSAPGQPAPEPYRVWLSEVMLQQTTVATVTPRFDRFLDRWPTLDALASAPAEDVLSEWAGLGYYARARNLIACAKAVAARGGFPESAAELRQLPGIGPYTAAAIAAIAFGERAPAIDTNIERVLARVNGLEAPARSELEAILLAALPSESPGDVIQALMDLGATICTPRNPRCAACPLHDGCKAFASGDPEAFPRRKAKAARPHRTGVAWWIERDGAVWLVRRPASGLLGGMAALPGGEWGEARAPHRAIASVRHGFTHFTLDLAIVAGDEPVGEGWWQPLSSIGEAGLPTLYWHAVDAVLEAHAPPSNGDTGRRLEEAPSGP